MRSLALSTCLLATLVSRALADPLTGTSLPEGTKWVLHLDVDAARAAPPLWNLIRVKIVEPQGAAITDKLAMIKLISGMDVPDQLHDATLFGDAFDPATACLRIHGILEEDRIIALLKTTDKEFTQTDHAGHDILRFRDKDKDRLVFAGFEAHLPAGASNTWVILSPDLHAVEQALDAMDGKTSLRNDSPLAPPAVTPPSPAPLFWIAARDLSDLPRVQQVESPLLSQIDAASLSLTWSTNRVTAGMRIDAKTEQVAQQFLAVAEGAKAFVALSAADEKASPQVRLLSAALQQLTVQTDGKSIKGEWSVETQKIEMLMNLALQGQAAAAPASAKP